VSVQIKSLKIVMAGLDPAIHGLAGAFVDARVEPGHDARVIELERIEF
jgi:hypothetical protein